MQSAMVLKDIDAGDVNNVALFQNIIPLLNKHEAANQATKL